METSNRLVNPKSLALIPALTLALSTALSNPAFADYYQQTNLVSDIPGLAVNTDPNLVNPWGISFSPTGPFWVSNNGTATSTLYNGSGNIMPLVVTIPGAGNVTGQVFNGGSSFNSDRFIFASEDGTISGWRNALGTNAETLIAGSSASVYKGLAIGNTGGNNYLYAANFKTGTIDLVKGTNSAPDLTGTFTDPNIPTGYAPFNIQNLGGRLLVTYALQDTNKEDEVAGAGNGFLNEFDLNGNFIQRLVSQGNLNSPWGLAIAPADFGTFSNALLVGNFGDGKINAFNSTTGTFLGSLNDSNNNPLTIDGLWGLTFGNGGNAGKTNELFFAAGINQEVNGLFGKLQARPVPEAQPLTFLGSVTVLALGISLKRRLVKN